MTIDNLKNAFDDVADDHEAYTRHHPLKRRFYVELVEQFLAAVDKIIELACGNGFYGSLCLRCGADVSFLDVNQRMLQAVRHRNGPSISLIQGDIRRLPIADATFDKTLCFGAMPPLPTEADMEAAIHEFVRITKPGGLVFFTYNPPNLLRHISVRYARLLAMFKPSLRTLPFVDGRTNGCQPHVMMKAIVARTGKTALFSTAGLGVFGLVCIKV